MALGAWFSFDEDERRDAQRVAELEGLAKTAHPVMAAELLTEADELREKWDEPRRRFSSVAEVVDELQSIARDALEVDVADSDALEDLGERASRAGISLEQFASDLETLDS